MGLGFSKLTLLPLPKVSAAKQFVRTELPASQESPDSQQGEFTGDTLIDSMLADGRGALLLRPSIVDDLDEPHRAAVAKSFLATCGPVGGGDVRVTMWQAFESWDDDFDSSPSSVESFYLDRRAVTNRDFRRFVVEGGYLQESLWASEIWPTVSAFVDRDGVQAPKNWSNGLFPDGHGDRPVVGVSWYEADAFARWVGKRLPTDAEWVKAASWPVVADDLIVQRKYPWGDDFDRGRANLGQHGPTHPVSVDDHADGDSAGGHRQLVGNVWEWTCDPFHAACDHGDVELRQPTRSIRGGAFDSYFDTQATCQLSSGDSPLARRHNIGFRCAISACDLALDDSADIPAEATT